MRSFFVNQIEKKVLVILLIQLLVDELGHAVIGLLEYVAVLFPFLRHLPTIVVYHDPSGVGVRIPHQLVELVDPVTGIHRSLDVLVSIGTRVHVVDPALLQRV